ncbi:MAG: hypothetical protein NTY01_21495 [Verrucomicrobia bacterium]|nr:hypothetical protein [Verrucomicrobiota bacterium]
MELDARTFRRPVGEWASCTVNLSPFYLKFSRTKLVGIEWRIGARASLKTGDKVFRAEVADVTLRAQTMEEKFAEMQDPFLRQMRERKPLQTPYITDRFWMGLWGSPFNHLNQSAEGTRQVSGRDMLAHHVEVFLNGGGAWWLSPWDAAAGKTILDSSRERTRKWLDDQCRLFDIKVILNVDGIAKDADTDPKVFKANMDGLMSAFAKEPLIIGWDGLEESKAEQAREYLTAQFAIEDRNPHQPMIAYLGDLNFLHRFIHAFSPACYPIKDTSRNTREVEFMMRWPWRYEPPAVWPILQGSAFANCMPTPAETRMMNHFCIAGGAGGIFYWRYGGVLPYGAASIDQGLVDPFCNPSPTWTEYGLDAPVCIRIGTTTCLMRRDEKASSELQKAQGSESAKLACAVLRPRKLFASEMLPGANQYAAKRLQQMAGSAVVLVINTDTNATLRVRPDLGPVAGMKPFFTFPGGQPCPTATPGKVRDPVELVPGGVAGWLCGSAEQARAANLAGDYALYLNCVRLPRYDIVFAKRWKADATAAEAWLAKADRACAAGNYADALDLQVQAESQVQRALAAQADYAAVTPGLNEIKVRLGQMITRIRDARIEGPVKDGDEIARGRGLAGTFAALGMRYNRDLLPVWVNGGAPQLRHEVEQLRRDVLQLHAVADRELGPFRLPAMAATAPDSSTAQPAISTLVVAPVVQPVTKPSEPPVVSGGGTINLLPLIDPEKDAVVASWKSTADGLRLEKPKGAAVLELPYMPPEEYDFEIEFTPADTGIVNQFLSAGDRSFVWKMARGKERDRAVFEVLDGAYFEKHNEGVSEKRLPLESDRRYVSKVEVRRGSLRGLLNGEEFVKWSGDFSRLSWDKIYKRRDARLIGVGSWGCGVIFHRIEVREVTGKGTFTRTSPQTK